MSEKERMTERELLALAVSRNTSAEKLSELAKENSWDVRKLVAGNPNTSTDVLIKLSEDEDWDVREEVARNPNTPINVLNMLSKDSNWHVRKMANDKLAIRKK